MNVIHNDVDAESAVRGCDDLVGALERLFAFAVTVAEYLQVGLVARGLTRARAAVIWQVHRHGPATQRQLARTLGVTARNITGLVDGLEATGFVVRLPHPKDRRATLVTLTDAGMAVTRQLEADYSDASAHLFAGMTGPDVDRFTATVDLLTRRFAAVGGLDCERRAGTCASEDRDGSTAGGPRPQHGSARR